MKKISILFTLIATLIFFAGCGESETKQAQVIKKEPAQEAQKPQESVVLTTMQGKKFEVSFSNNVMVSKDLNGKVVLINFFATWCPPCIDEIPVFNKMYEKYGDVFEIVAVLHKDEISKEDLQSFIEFHKIKFPVVVEEEANAKAAKMFDEISKIPESFLFSKDGFLFEKYVGIVDEKILEDYLIKNQKEKQK